MFDEPQGAVCLDALHSARRLAISAGTLIELATVTARPSRRDIWSAFKRELHLEVFDVTAAFADAASRHYAKWGKGLHPAKLNLGDIYAYTLAKQLDVPLLYIGDDFAQTDVKSALPSPRPLTPWHD